MMVVQTGVATTTFIYGHPSSIAKGILRINPPAFSYNIEYFDDEPFERTRISEPFKTIEIEIEPSRILDKKKKLGLSERGYRFKKFEYHQHPYRTGVHIQTDKSKKETVAGMSARAGNYKILGKFKAAMEELGFKDLKEEIVKYEIIDLIETLKLKI